MNGKCGAFFGLWWTPNNPLMDEYRKNKEADWEPYYLTADVKRTVEVYSTFRIIIYGVRKEVPRASGNCNEEF